MKTDELIETLGVTVERVEGRSFRSAFIVALFFGAALAVCVMQAVLGISPSALRASQLWLLILIAAFVVGVVVAGSRYLLKSAYPGMSMRGPTALIVALVAAFLCAGVAGLLAVDPAARSAMIFGPMWTVCRMKRSRATSVAFKLHLRVTVRAHYKDRTISQSQGTLFCGDHRSEREHRRICGGQLVHVMSYLRL